MSKLGIGIVGAGFIAQVHADALSRIEQAELKAIYNRTASRARALGDKYHVDWYDNFGDLLARDDIDIIDICTASGTHADFAIPAAKAGKHLIIEKPLEISVERAFSIIEAAERQGVFLAVIFQNRFKEAVQITRAALEEGRFGKLVLGDAHIKWYRPPEYYQGWKGTKRYDGGAALINQGIHTIDLLQWMMGPVEEVFGYISTRAHKIEGEDVGIGALRFRSGALGIIEGSTAVYPGLPERLGIYGTNGTVEIEGNTIVNWSFRGEGGEDSDARKAESRMKEGGSSSPTGIGIDLHHRQLEEIVRAIQAGEEPPVPGREAVKSLAIVEAIYTASQSGKPCRPPPEVFH